LCKLILLVFFRKKTLLHWSAGEGLLEVSCLLVRMKAQVAARDWCFSPPPSHRLSLTICLAAMAKLHSNAPSITNYSQKTWLHSCAASTRGNDAPPPRCCPACCAPPRALARL
jgi:hypothetical protein